MATSSNNSDRICTACHEAKSVADFYPDRSSKAGIQSRCKECSKRLAVAWRHRNRERALETNRRSQEKCSARRKAYTKDYYRANAEELKAKERMRQRELKDQAYAAYGGYRCACCGESEPMFLCLDHVNNDGYEHRKEVHPRKLYAWLKRKGYPEGFQVLCFNCNQGKRLNGGVCPHRVKKANSESIGG